MQSSRMLMRVAVEMKGLLGASLVVIGVLIQHFFLGIDVLTYFAEHPSRPIMMLAFGLIFMYRAAQTGTLGAYSVNLQNRNAIVTGGNRGIGYYIALRLVEWGANVTIACRNEESGQEAIRSILRALPQANKKQLSTLILDLSSLESVRSAALKWKAAPGHDALHILVNNAAVIMPATLEMNKDGFEAQWGANVLGHFLFTQLLLTPLKKDGSRVVNVSSLGHLFSGERMDYGYVAHPDPARYDKNVVYGYSKAANIMHARELTNRYGREGITGYSVHPGFVMTTNPGERAMNLFKRTLGCFIAKTPETAADSVLYCAVHDDAIPGEYHQNAAVFETDTDITKDDGACRQLWQEAERMIELRARYAPPS